MKSLRTILSLLLVVLASIFSIELATPSPTDVDGFFVSRVVDGDTIIASKDGEDYRVRLIGIDTPETVHPKKGVEPWGEEASAFTTKELEGQTVYLEYDEEEEDDYGRKLAYIWTENPETSEQEKEDILFNYTLVREGYARERDYPPNTKYQRLLQRAEVDAIDENRGLWAVEGDRGPAKGNKKSQIYHLPGDSHYNTLSKQSIIYFDNAKEAEKAGYQRSFR